MRLSRFNEAGISSFGSFLDVLQLDPSSRVPVELLTDPSCVTVVLPATEIETQGLSTRMDLARYLDGTLQVARDIDIDRDVGLWSWLSLFLFDKLCPRDGNGRRKVGERARYIPAVTDYSRYYRHLLAGPYRVFRVHRGDPDRALVLLCGPIDRPGEIVEQLVARSEIITNPNAMALATRIYFDPRTGSFKRGAAGKGSGSARRLADVLNQFDVTWDLQMMPVERILEKLPGEFDRFRTGQ